MFTKGSKRAVPFAFAVGIAIVVTVLWSGHRKPPPDDGAIAVAEPAASANSPPGSSSETLSTATPMPTLPSPTPQSVSLTDDDRRQVAVLEQILKSRDDNDPRMDTELRNLSPQAKIELRNKYIAMSAESRNERGTIVFVLGREMKTSEDAAFLASVVAEPPCLSMQDCGRRPDAPVDEHAAMANEVSLVYPQLVAVKSFERVLKSGDLSTEVKKAAIEALQRAERSENSKVSQSAQGVLANVKF